MRRLRARRRVATLICVIALCGLAAGCSSGETSTLPRESTSLTTQAEAPATTEPPQTAPLTADTSIAGSWLVVREVVEDDGLFGSNEVAEAREWEITCDSEDCSSVQFDSAFLGLDPTEPAAPGRATFDGERFEFSTTELLACLEPDTQDYTGPEVAEFTQTVDVEVTERRDGQIVSMGGTETQTDTIPETGAGACVPGSTAGTSDQVMFRADLAGVAALPVGVARGAQNLTGVEGEQLGPNASVPGRSGTFEYRILPCDDTDCAFIVRTRMTTGETFDVPVSGSAQDAYSGSAERVRNCESDTTGEVLYTESYMSTTTVTAGAYDVAGGEVLHMLIEEDLRPIGDAVELDPDNCYAATFTSEFLGRVVTDPVDAFDEEGTVAVPTSSPPEISADGEILFAETVSGFVVNTVRAYGEDGLDGYVIADAVTDVYPTLFLATGVTEADTRTVSFLSSTTVTDKDLPSAENQLMIAVAAIDTSGECLGTVIYGYPTPDQTYTVEGLEECSAQSVADAFLATI